MSRRFRSALHVGRRRKSSIVSTDTTEVPTRTRTSSFGTTDGTPIAEEGAFQEAMTRPFAPVLSPTNTLTPDNNDEAVDDAHSYRSRRAKRHRHHRPSFRRHHRRKKSDRASSHTVTDSRDFIPGEEPIAETPEVITTKEKLAAGEPRRIDFAVTDIAEGSTSEMNPTGRRTPFSVRPIFRNMAPSVFMQPMDLESGLPLAPIGPVPAVRIGLRRVKSLPDRLNAQYNQTAMMPSQIPIAALSGPAAAAAAKSKAEEENDDLSRLSSILLLIVSTGLVAACANFMVDSIQGLVESSSIGEVFIGLIILPIVGNAAEHVTAITVAMKNKMDLAIGVAVGSSIQIALFITPLVVILGWIMEKKMSLYFTLFETVCLFVSAFIVNFLVLDGRSNYLEGALLCATYTIIGVVAFYYPNAEDCLGCLTP
jgi:Ca2+:H+ antiporter